MEFLLAHEGKEVSTHTFHHIIILGSHGNSWETTVTFRTLGTFGVREMCFVASSPSFQRVDITPRQLEMCKYC